MACQNAWRISASAAARCSARTAFSASTCAISASRCCTCTLVIAPATDASGPATRGAGGARAEKARRLRTGAASLSAAQSENKFVSFLLNHCLANATDGRSDGHGEKTPGDCTCAVAGIDVQREKNSMWIELEVIRFGRLHSCYHKRWRSRQREREAALREGRPPCKQ